MNKKILNYLIFIIIALILLYFARNNYRDFNINKTISACVLAKMQTNKTVSYTHLTLPTTPYV